jgi:hypothetical protein
MSVGCKEEVTPFDNTSENWARLSLIWQASHLNIAVAENDWSHWDWSMSLIQDSLCREISEMLDDSKQRDALLQACEEFGELGALSADVILGRERLPTHLTDDVKAILDRMNAHYFGS